MNKLFAHSDTSHKPASVGISFGLDNSTTSQQYPLTKGSDSQKTVLAALCILTNEDTSETECSVMSIAGQHTQSCGHSFCEINIFYSSHDLSTRVRWKINGRGLLSHLLISGKSL